MAQHPSEWPLVWTRLFPALIEQLPSTVVAPMKMAFNVQEASSLAEFFGIMNGKGAFTGPNAKENTLMLLDVLSPAHGSLSAVIALNGEFTRYFTQSARLITSLPAGLTVPAELPAAGTPSSSFIPRVRVLLVKEDAPPKSLGAFRDVDSMMPLAIVRGAKMKGVENLPSDWRFLDSLDDLVGVADENSVSLKDVLRKDNNVDALCIKASGPTVETTIASTPPKESTPAPRDPSVVPLPLMQELAPQKPVTFTLGTLSCTITYKGTATCCLPPHISAASWQDLGVFLSEIVDTPDIHGVQIIVPPGATRDVEPRVVALMQATRKLMAAINLRKECEQQGVECGEPVPEEERLRLQRIAKDYRCPFIQSADKDFHPPDPEQGRLKREKVSREEGGKLVPVELWCITTRQFEGKDVSRRNKVVTYGYTPIDDASKATFGQMDTEDDFIFDPNVKTCKDWIAKIASNGLPIVVYIHGYSNTLLSALDSAGRLWKQLNEQRSKKPVNVILFSWASRGGFFGAAAYSGDFERINHATNIAVFNQFITDLLDAGVTERTLVFAHSMGNVLLMSTIAEHPVFSLERNFKCVFSVAPAVVAQYWIQYAHSYYKRTGRQVVLCCTTTDLALKAMRLAEGDVAAGRIYDVPLCSLVHQTVEVPADIAALDDSLKSHSYFYTPHMAKLMISALQCDRLWTPFPSYALCDPSTRKKAGAWCMLDDSPIITIDQRLTALNEQKMALEKALQAIQPPV